MPSQLRARDVKKPKTQITNIVAKAQLVPPFTLSSLESKHPFDHGKKYNPKQVFHGSRISISHDPFKFSVFRTGTIMSLVSRSLNELDDSFIWLSSFLADFNLQLSDKHDIINITGLSDFLCAFNLFELVSRLHSDSSFDPSPLYSGKDDQLHLDCITFYFYDKTPRYTALIFSSGKIIFTGFKSIPTLKSHARELSSLLSKISFDHPGVLVK